MQTKDTSPDLIYEVTKDAIAFQQTQRASMENKANTLMGFAGVVFTILVGATTTLQKTRPLAQQVVIICVILFAISVILSLIIIWVRKYRTDPNPAALAEKYLDKPETEVKLQIISNMLDAWKANAETLKLNSSLLVAAFAIQALAFLLLAAAIVLGLMYP